MEPETMLCVECEGVEAAVVETSDVIAVAVPLV